MQNIPTLQKANVRKEVLNSTKLEHKVGEKKHSAIKLRN